jgi:hypothetical protein
MAAISISDCKVYKKSEGEFTETIIITPSTADSNDTVDTSTVVADGLLCGLTGWDVETGDSVTATYATGTGIITIDAAGGTTNHTYALTLRYVDYIFTP